jgi:hypothetical protein
MSKLSLAERLDVAISTAAENAEAGLSSRQVAITLYQDERELIADFADQWIIEKLAGLIRARRARVRQNPAQIVFGFALTKAIVVEDGGTPVPHLQATLRKLRRYRRVKSKERRSYLHPEVRRIDREIEFMIPYAAEERGITLERALELEMQKRRAGVRS